MNSSRKAGFMSVSLVMRRMITCSKALKMKKIICLVGAICLSGCVVTEKEVMYKRISFADKDGVTTVYYPPTWQKFLKPMDDGTPKTMLVRFGATLNTQTE